MRAVLLLAVACCCVLAKHIPHNHHVASKHASHHLAKLEEEEQPVIEIIALSMAVGIAASFWKADTQAKSANNVMTLFKSSYCPAAIYGLETHAAANDFAKAAAWKEFFDIWCDGHGYLVRPDLLHMVNDKLQEKFVEKVKEKIEDKITEEVFGQVHQHAFSHALTEGVSYGGKVLGWAKTALNVMDALDAEKKTWWRWLTHGWELHPDDPTYLWIGFETDGAGKIVRPIREIYRQFHQAKRAAHFDYDFVRTVWVGEKAIDLLNELRIPQSETVGNFKRVYRSHRSQSGLSRAIVSEILSSASDRTTVYNAIIDELTNKVKRDFPEFVRLYNFPDQLLEDDKIPDFLLEQLRMLARDPAFAICDNWHLLYCGCDDNRWDLAMGVTGDRKSCAKAIRYWNQIRDNYKYTVGYFPRVDHPARVPQCDTAEERVFLVEENQKRYKRAPEWNIFQGPEQCSAGAKWYCPNSSRKCMVH
eukprot:c8435_g1_i1.p1 GENE.c8435_g1_i1~~c8435_g1_i1.p1  ORF type:complete len:475 (-),score=82.38 c8435_g1_i1:6-1430(-)